MKTSLTSEEKKQQMLEVHRRLQTAEAKKARELLSMAMSNYEAFKFVHEDIKKSVSQNGDGTSIASQLILKTNGIKLPRKF